MKKKHEIKGVYLIEEKTFYYLEAGSIKISNPVERILKSLVARSKLRYESTPRDMADIKTVIMSLAEAEEKKYNIEKLFLNQHIKKNTIVTPQENEKVSWLKNQVL